MIIIGAGVSGASAALHLANAGVDGVLVLEAGQPGDGSFEPTRAPAHAAADSKAWSDEGTYLCAGRSGTAVLPSTGTIKQIMTSYYCSSPDFIRHHGEDGARVYLQASMQGLELQV